MIVIINEDFLFCENLILMSIHRLKPIYRALILLLCLISAPVYAQLNIEIFGGGASRIPIAIVPLLMKINFNKVLRQ